MAMQTYGIFLDGHGRDRRRRVGVPVSTPVRRARRQSDAWQASRPPRLSGDAASRTWGAEVAARANRRHTETARGTAKDCQTCAVVRTHRAGRAQVVDAPLHDDRRGGRRCRLPGCDADGAPVARRAGLGIRCRRWIAILDFVVSQEAAGIALPRDISGRRRCHRSRHQGRSAVAR